MGPSARDKSQSKEGLKSSKVAVENKGGVTKKPQQPVGKKQGKKAANKGGKLTPEIGADQRNAILEFINHAEDVLQRSMANEREERERRAGEGEQKQADEKKEDGAREGPASWTATSTRQNFVQVVRDVDEPQSGVAQTAVSAFKQYLGWRGFQQGGGLLDQDTFVEENFDRFCWTVPLSEFQGIINTVEDDQREVQRVSKQTPDNSTSETDSDVDMQDDEAVAIETSELPEGQRSACEYLIRVATTNGEATGAYKVVQKLAQPVHVDQIRWRWQLLEGGGECLGAQLEGLRVIQLADHEELGGERGPANSLTMPVEQVQWELNVLDDGKECLCAQLEGMWIWLPPGTGEGGQEQVSVDGDSEDGGWGTRSRARRVSRDKLASSARDGVMGGKDTAFSNTEEKRRWKMTILSDAFLRTDVPKGAGQPFSSAAASTTPCRSRPALERSCKIRRALRHSGNF